MTEENFAPVLTHDPYDLWSTALGVAIRREFYSNTASGKAAAVAVSAVDWLFPALARSFVLPGGRTYAIVCAQLALKALEEGHLDEPTAKWLMQILSKTSLGKDAGYRSWGLGFDWMSKNGLYRSDVPTITQTPYVLEALLAVRQTIPSLRSDAETMFYDTFGFLTALPILFESDDEIAVSYAPRREPRIVFNANAYAALCFALHARYGRSDVESTASTMATRIVNWIIRRQREDGSWLYYADDQPGNFLDCFHSCFVIKNLRKVGALLPALQPQIRQTNERGLQYIKSAFYKSEHGLCDRFAVRHFTDPFRWDIYDQAEYLGLLVDFGELAGAQRFCVRVERAFRAGPDWWCRLDFLGRRWGKNFLRWGIVPFMYQRARLYCALAQASRS